MAEKEKCNEPLRESSSQSLPAKDQIIARLVQIREYTEKAEEALHAVPPNSQNDPKFYQLQEMLAEMRETEKRLTDILRDYDMESPFRNRLNIENPQVLTSNYASNISDDVGEDFSLLGAHSINAVEPGLLAERDKLRKRCQDSQLKIEALEKQKNYLLEVCGRADGEKSSAKNTPGCNDQDLEIDNRVQIVREADSSMFSRRSQSTGGLLSSEDLFMHDDSDRKLPEVSDKRLEIHNIISEIALLRRAKDESARKIDLLQQALNSNTVNGDPVNFEPLVDKSDQLTELMTDAGRESDRDHSSDNGSFLGAPWMTDTFSQTITRKLTEIQTMREKLDALQSLVHTIPVPSSYQSFDTQGDMNSTRAVYGSDASSRVSFIELREQVQDICNQMNRESYRGRFNLSSSDMPNRIRLKTQSVFPVTVPSVTGMQIQRHRGVLATGESDDAGTLEDRNLDYSRQGKGSSNSIQNNYYSEMDMRRSRIRSNKKPRSRGSSDYNDDRDRERSTQRPGISTSSQRQESPSSSFVVYNPREIKPAPAPLWEHPPGITEEPVLFSVSGRYGQESRNINGRDDEFGPRNTGGSIDIDRLSVAAFSTERGQELMSAEDRIVGNPVSDGNRNWGPFPNSPGMSNFRGYNNNPTTVLNGSHNYNSFGVEKYISESNSMLKHIVQSIGLVATGLTSQKKQLDVLKESVDRLTQRVDFWMEDASSGSRAVPDDQIDMRRNNVGHGAFSLDGKAIPGILPNIGSSVGLEARGNSGCEHGVFFQGSRGHHNRHQELPFGCASPRAVKGINPVREMWSSASNAPLNVNYPSDQPNLHPFGDEPSEMLPSSAFYGSSQPIAPKVKRPWVSPSSSMEPNRLMLNNQVPPGNRANNYWDNFRSQSRQNVLSSTSKSNESFNTVLAINPEAAHNQAAGVSASSNFNRLDPRHDKNPGAKPIKAVMMKHFVENIGSKKRNQEQQRQLFPQRSVSVGSMHHLGGEHSGASTSEPSQANVRHGTNDVNTGAQCFGMNKLYLNNPRDLSVNKVMPKDANLLTQALPSRDYLKEMCSKVSQLKSDHIRQRTIDALRNYVAQSVLQDQMEVHAESDSSFSRANIELQGSEPVPGTSHTQTSTPSSRSGDLNEVMWLDPDPFMSSDSRLLPYAGNGGINSIPPQSGTSGTSHREGGLFDDTQAYLRSGSRLPAYTRTERDRTETISSSSTGTSRPGTLNDLWMDSLRMPFVADDSRLPPFIQSDRTNPIASNSSSRQGAFNDLCMDSGDGDPFLSSVSLLPSTTSMRTASESPSTSLISRFQEHQKSMAETGGQPPSPSSSNARVGTDGSLSAIYKEERQQLPEDKLHSGDAAPNVGLTENEKEISTAVVSAQNAGDRNDIGGGIGVAVSPLHDLSAVEADLDASLMNVSGSKFLSEAGTPDSSSPAVNSGFDSSIKYKGRSMNSTNNPWVSNPKSSDELNNVRSSEYQDVAAVEESGLEEQMDEKSQIYGKQDKE